MKQILLTLAVVLLALGAWMLLGTPATVSPAVLPTPTAPTPAPDEPERGGPELEVADVPLEPESERSAVEATEEPGAAAAVAPDGLVLSEPFEDGIAFQVVVEATGEPLPHAILTAVGEARAQEQGAKQLMMAGMGIDAILDKIGVHYRCDAEGRVSIDPRNADALIRGRGEVDGRLHSGMSEGEAGERVVRVRPVAGFDVRVVDIGGAPVRGARVELVIERDFGPVSQRMSFNSVAVGDDGRAFVANTMAGLPGGAERMLDDGRVLIALAGLFHERPEVEVDWRAADPEPIELVAPAMGTVAVTVQAASGVPPAGVLVLHHPDTVEDQLGMPDGRGLQRAATGEEVAAGPLVFEGIERGLTFTLSYLVDGQDEPEVLGGLMLAADRTRLDVMLELEVEVRRLGARVLLPSGEPLVGTEVHIGRRRSWRATPEVLDRATTDDDGRIELPAPWLGEMDLVLWHRDATGEELAADLPTDGWVEAEVLELGDLTLEGEVLLLAGRVVDADGEGVSVQLSLVEPGTGPGVIQAVAVDSGARSVSMPEGQRWETRSSDSGAFSFHGRSGADELTLWARTEQYLAPEALVVARGSEDVVLTLERAARFHFELPELHPMLRAGIYLVIPEEPGNTTYHGTYDGWSPPLPAGVHDFYLTLGGGEAAMVYEGTVQLAPGEQRELGLLALQQPILQHEVEVELIGDADPDDIWVTGRRSVAKPDGGVSLVTVGYGSREWPSADEPPGPDDTVFLFFTLEPLTEVVVTLGSAELVVPVAEGRTHVVFDPSQHGKELDDATREALQGLGYL